MSLFGNIGEFIEEKESWTQYTERLNQFFRANDIVNEEKKAAIFLSTIGSSAYKVLGNLLAPKKPAEESYTRMVEVMKSFYNPTPSVTIQRFRFYSRFRQPGESILAFVADLRSLAKDCEFGASLEENLRDRLVCGVSDPVIQKRLLSEEKLTYKKACELAQGLESAARDIKTLQGSTQSEVHKLKTSSSCYRCGKLGHTSENCQFKSAICHYCGKLGHIRSVCLSRTRSFNRRSSFCSSTSPSTRSTSSRSFCPSTDVVKTLKEEHEGNSEYTLFTIPAASSRPPLYTTVSVDKQQLTMEVDTGASFSVISRKTYQKLFSFKPLQQSNVKLKTYSGEPLPVHGSITVEVCEGTQKMSLNLLVIGDSGPSLLGRDWMHCLRLNWNSILHLQVHSLNNLLQKHSDVFKDELGTLKDFEAKIYIEPGANPRFCKARPVPYAYRSKVEAELDRLIEQNIIEPIPFSDWAAPIVPVLKADNTIRICGDYKVTVNQVSKLDRYPIPKIEDLFAKLSGGTVFTKLDLSQAYQQLMLDEESKKYVVINTHRGLFRYNRLPFGISSAPGIFQRTMESFLQGIPKVVVCLP